MKKLVLAALAAAAACSPAQSPLMRPGEDCMSCHAGANAATLEAPVWTVAGTVYDAVDPEPNAGVEDAYVHVTDAQGALLTLRSNAAGNFYAADPIVYPLQVCVERNGAMSCMRQPAPTGACNSCHTIPAQNAAPGRITLP
jgi:hypothetical protein